MTPKAFLTFSGVTALVVVASMFIVVERYATATFVKEKEPIFPAMHDKVNEVTELLYEDKQVRIKVARRNGTVLNAAPEFDDCVRLATASAVSVKEIQAAATKAWLDAQGT